MKFKTSHIWTLASLERELRLLGGWGALTSEQRQAFEFARRRLAAAFLENELEGATNFADNCRLAALEIERGLTFSGGGGRVTVAALFVEADGVYSRIAGVDPWDVDRDARLYRGPHPVVAHPPCKRLATPKPFAELLVSMARSAS